MEQAALFTLQTATLLHRVLHGVMAAAAWELESTVVVPVNADRHQDELWVG